MKKTVGCGLLLLTIGCAERESVPATTATQPVVAATAVHEMQMPATIGVGGAEPFLSTGRDGSLLLSWLESNEVAKTAALKVARFSSGRWSAPSVVVSRNDLFVNWADFPSVIEASDRTLFAHWLQKSGSGTYAYDVMLARSRDGGATWSKAAKLNDDSVQGEHGFVSLTPHPTNPIVSAVWLDGRNMTEGEGHEGHGDMTLRFANVASDGRVSDVEELDGRTCECCTTGMTWTEAGPLVAYRDRSADEIRDISLVQKLGDAWTAPRTLHADGWKIEGCPVNGPQVDARGRNVVAAWFTAAGDKPQVYVAFSSDSGSSFGKLVKIDAGHATGRVDVVLLDDGRAFATWIDGAGSDAAIVARTIAPNGAMGTLTTVARSSTARGAGFPRAALAGDGLYVAWTELLPSKRIRLARLDLE
jgi:hypothetical protein